MLMSNLAVCMDEIWNCVGDRASAPSCNMANLSTIEAKQNIDSNYCFADIYLRNAPHYLEEFLADPQGSVHGEMRGANKSVLAFDDGACEITASSSFLTVAMSASDQAELDRMRGYVEQKLRKISKFQPVDIDWRTQ